MLIKNHVHRVAFCIRFSKAPITINKGDKIAQLILEKVMKPSITIVDNLSQPQRNTNGSTSTGSMRSGKYKQSK